MDEALQDDLARFVLAQDTADSFVTAVAELSAGAKKSHWMWWIFPQLKGLGTSQRAMYYGINGADEARRYLLHPVLGARLLQVTQIVTELPTTDAVAVFGEVDAVKLQAAWTLFAAVATDPKPFEAGLAHYFAGAKHDATLAMLANESH